MALEEIFPGICLTLFEHLWTPEMIRSHGFTHIIRIDRHMARRHHQLAHQQQQQQRQRQQQQQQQHQHQPPPPPSYASFPNPASAVAAASGTCTTMPTTNVVIVAVPTTGASAAPAIAAGTATDCNANVIADVEDYDDRYAGFKTLDLNFGEDAYLSSVLPNCYKGVTFIESALRSGGTVLIIDRLNKQKCITVVIGFLMYNYHIKFSTAFQRVKQIHPNLELDGFYQTQLHEYEPILQVQRTQAYGNSCSRELRCTQSKRKLSSVFDDDNGYGQVSSVASSRSVPVSAAAAPPTAAAAAATTIVSVTAASALLPSAVLYNTGAGGGGGGIVLHDSTCPSDILME